MIKAFKWLCRICFCIVLAAITLGMFELVYFDNPKTTHLGCRVGEYANIYCGEGALPAVKEFILNLPFGFAMAPPILFRPSSILNDIVVPPSMHPRLKYTHPLVIYLYSLNLIIILSIIQIFRVIAWFATGRWRELSHVDQGSTQ